MTNRLRLAGIAVAAVIVYTTAIAIMFEGHRSELAILAMLAVATAPPSP